MPRKLRSATLATRTARLKLAQRTKPHWTTIAPGVSLGYRRNEGVGSWSVRAADGKGGNWIKSFALADDQEDAGGKVMTFWQAAEKAKALARGQDADAGRPVTLSEAIRDYRDDLNVRGARANNASRLYRHLPAPLLAKPVAMLTARELKHWRNALAASAPASTVNRTAKVLKAALNLAAADDDRIINRMAWTTGLAAIPEPDARERKPLTDEQRRDVVAASYAISPEFGLYIEVHAVTGARSSQIALLNVEDLQAGATPRLMVPSSLKGKNRRTRTRTPVPISTGLALRLKQASAGRAASAPLLLNAVGTRWLDNSHREPFAKAAQAAGLPSGVTAYALRHSAIMAAVLTGAPIRLVAASFDTSVAMIEATYSRYISDHGDALMRRALFDLDEAPAAGGNVVALKR